MGKHTAYWRQYQKAQVRGSVRIVAAIAAWLLLVVLVALVQEALGMLFPVVMAGAFMGLIVSVIVLGKGAYKVDCPECGSSYKRSKWFGQCPSCGLRLLQEDP
jgi:Zn finger protein HypA/HybF involved in hydrogenase expression